MSTEKRYTEAEAERLFAIRYHNQTWELLELKERSRDDCERMLDYAHASLAHWRVAGGPVHQQRGEWVLARVHTVLGNTAPALQHAQRCHELLLAHPADMQDFDSAFAFEALARANAAAGQRAEALTWLEKARQAGGLIQETEDREIFLSELNGGEWYGLK